MLNVLDELPLGATFSGNPSTEVAMDFRGVQKTFSKTHMRDMRGMVLRHGGGEFAVESVEEHGGVEHFGIVAVDDLMSASAPLRFVPASSVVISAL